MPGLSFEDVLNEALASPDDDDGGARFWTGPAPALFSFWSRPQQAASIATAERHSALGTWHPDGEPPAAAVGTLTGPQWEALEHLLSLGASLGPDFTARELRSAFRQLARRYHPDRHHGSTPTELARLTQVFARLSADYQCLLAAVA